MRWLFRSLDEDFDTSCSPGEIRRNKVTVYRCELTHNGKGVHLVYSEWRTFEAMGAHYYRKYGHDSHMDGPLTVSGPALVNQSYQSSYRFTEDFPYSVTIASRREEVTRDARSLLEVRPESELKGAR